MKRPDLLLTALLPFFLSSLSGAGSLPSAKPKARPTPLRFILQDLRGPVTLREKATGRSERALEEQTLRPGDEVLTGPGARASLSLGKDTLVQVSEKSGVHVSKLRPSKSGSGFLSRLDLLAGKVLAEVEDLRRGGSSFEVSSGGVVCGVRGTAFEVDRDDRKVTAKTFHGDVEVRKGSQVRKVGADQGADFAFDQATFLPKRALTREERAAYQQWLTQKAVVERKLLERRAILQTLSNLPPGDQERIEEKLRAYPEKDRLRMTRKMLQDMGGKDRQEALERARQEAERKRRQNEGLRQGR